MTADGSVFRREHSGKFAVGAPTLYGAPCKSCGGTVRYANGSRNCVECARKRSKMVTAANAPRLEAERIDIARRKTEARALYEADFSIEKIAQMLKVCRATVHAWIHEDGDYRCRPWSPAELAIIRTSYEQSGGVAVDVKAVAKSLKRTYDAVALKASKMGLSNRAAKPRPESIERTGATLSLMHSIGAIQHPRGFLGKNHSEETRRKISMAHMGRKRPPVSAATRKKMSENMSARLTQSGNVYSRARRGRRDDLGNCFFRSSWEANVARWLTFTGRRWEFESKTFWFEKIRRGVRSYTPDFYLPDEGLFIEVKGWMDAKSRTKLKRMAKYYPDVRIELIDKPRYLSISTYAAVIPGWEAA